MRQNEQIEYAYDPAHNLHTRTNGSLKQTFVTDAANQLTNVTRTGAYTLSGATPAPATSVTVNGQAAQTLRRFYLCQNESNAGQWREHCSPTSLRTSTALTVTNIVTVNLPTSVKSQLR